ncbi:HEPN domain-containing protein [Rhodopseudomonas palustris]|uniref:HEPN domain-containing protein n=1 Tax=Rhodopseudomonas palustris TaxID=1076 RepID=UPI000E5AAD4D|nr:HEPN domain-containing protein [Rhodopseudomonas palustris]QLH73698.1 HEPN domain-containing protein [Rhodopseudomonas palustris]RHZ92391.1 HEPN domain-containing protein [Rhodopseudomonas palustris]
MSSSDPRTWLDLAASDVTAARRLLTPPASLPQAAYLAQQAAEKAIKARLIALHIAFPRHGGRGHDLVALTNLMPEDDLARSLFEQLSSITPWATAFRYPSDDPATEARLTAQEIETKLQQAEAAITLLRGALDRQQP